MAIERIKIVGVMGSGEASASDNEEIIALGGMIASLGCHLLTGGGEGVMAAAAKGFVKAENRAGLCVGILPARSEDDLRPPMDYPNPWVELPIQTHLGRGDDPDTPWTRNHINILSADALVFCPGNDGTYSELVLAHRYDKPRILYLRDSAAINGMGARELVELANATDDPSVVREFLRATIA